MIGVTGYDLSMRCGGKHSILKGNSGLAQMKECEKCKKNEPSLTSMRQMVLQISHLKVKNLSKMDVAFCRFLASFSLNNDVTDAICFSYILFEFD